MSTKVHVRMAENILHELAGLVTNAEPAMVTEWGDLFVSPNVPAAAIRLRKPLGEYATFLISQNPKEWRGFSKIVPVEGQPFQIVVNGAVEIKDGTTTINGKPAVIL